MGANFNEEHRRSARVLAENRSTVLRNWVEGQSNDRRIRPKLISQEDLTRQATRFLDAMILATAAGELEQVDDAAYEPIKRIIRETSQSRMDRGMTRLESTACFICFKDYWLPLLQVEFRHEPAALNREIVVVCKLNDTLALNMYEEIVHQGEEKILKQTNEILEARNHAESANRAKGDFLANMSHELRTPMNGILGMLELTLRSEIDPRHREYLGLAKSSAESLLRLLNDILDFSKIEAGKLELESMPFGLRASLDDTMKSLAAYVEEKGLELTYAVDADVPDSLVGDPGRLSQVLVNLVGNARKFTAVGEIDVRVELESQDDDGVSLHIAVRDTGIGIAPELHKQIFAPFTQADCSTTRQFGGTGLGLTICAKLAEAMGGRISVESQLGQGSTFHLTARFGVQDGNATGPPCQRLDLEGLSVLVVDDNATNRQILSEMLAHWRMKPTLVDGGRAALAAIMRASGAGAPFPLVLLDAAMPEMDGFSVAAQINQVPELAGTAILMLSSADLYRDTERCRALNIAAFLRKPIKESDLLDAISSTLSGRQATSAERSGPSHEPPPARARSLRVLLAEDHPVNQRLAVALLEDAGHSVVVANDGQDALEHLERKSFDLVLMDVQMPRMDGFQATAAIRAAEEGTGRHLKIIAMTAHAMKGDHERCLAAGMDGYISKPLQPEQFLAVIEGRDKPADATGAEAGLAPVVFDREEALKRALRDHGLLREVADLFLADCPGLLAEFRAGLDNADRHRLELAAHRMKGAAANLSAPRVVALAERLEELAHAGRLAEARSAFPDLEHEVGRLGGALEVLRRTSASSAH